MQGTLIRDSNTLVHTVIAPTTPHSNSHTTTTATERDKFNLVDTFTTTASSSGTENDNLAITSTGASDTTSSTREPITGSLFRYILVGALCGILLITVIIAEIIILLCLVFQIRRKTVTVASTAVARSTRRHKHHNNPKSKETPIVLHDSSRHHQYSPIEFINDSPAKVSIGEGHRVQEPSKPGGKFAKNPIYIHLEPAETNQTVPQRPIICKNNQAYIHLGPEDLEASVEEDILIKCKQNSAYIHLSPETEPRLTDATVQQEQ